MHVFQTAGAPPSVGRSIFAHMGSRKKRRLELRRIVNPKSQAMPLIYIIPTGFRDFQLTGANPAAYS